MSVEELHSHLREATDAVILKIAEKPSLSPTDEKFLEGAVLMDAFAKQWLDTGIYNEVAVAADQQLLNEGWQAVREASAEREAEARAVSSRAAQLLMRKAAEGGGRGRH